MSLAIDDSVDLLVWWIEERSCSECGVYMDDRESCDSPQCQCPDCGEQFTFSWGEKVCQCTRRFTFKGINEYWKKAGEND